MTSQNSPLWCRILEPDQLSPITHTKLATWGLLNIFFGHMKSIFIIAFQCVLICQNA